MPDPLDRRFLDLAVASPDEADVVLVGLPYDGAVIGRKGCREGPKGIREAFRWIGTDDPRRGSLQRKWHDAGDVTLDAPDVLGVHAQAAEALQALFAHGKPLVVLGGDNSLSMPSVQALAKAYKAGPAMVGLLVVDAHYDMRAYTGQPTSGTPFRRILEELPGRPVTGSGLVEVGIRRHANAASLGAYAAAHGVHIIPRDDVRDMGARICAREAVKRVGARAEHIWLSIDIDALDQSIAPGCSAPSPDGLLLHEVFAIVEAVARDPRCRGMEIMETAPPLDPTGNTCRAAAALVARFIASLP